MKICGEEGSESDYDYPDGLLLPPPSSPSPSQLTRSPRLDSSPGLDCWSESVIRVSDLTSLCKQTRQWEQWGTDTPSRPGDCRASSACSLSSRSRAAHHNILLDIFSLCFAPVSVVLWLWAANDICLAEWWSANWCRPDGPSSLAWLLWGNWDVTWPDPAQQAACLISLIIPW